MGAKIIKASNERYEYNRDTYQNAIAYTKTLAAATVTKITSNTTTLRYNGGGVLATTTRRIPFDTLVGNIPYSGVILIETEYIRYASVTWTGATTGYLNECTRGYNSTTVATHADLTAISFVNLMSNRSKYVIYNYTGGDLYVGSNANITGGINSEIISDGSSNSIDINTNVDLWVLSSGGGNITIVEYL